MDERRAVAEWRYSGVSGAHLMDHASINSHATIRASSRRTSGGALGKSARQICTLVMIMFAVNGHSGLAPNAVSTADFNFRSSLPAFTDNGGRKCAQTGQKLTEIFGAM